MRKLLWLGCLSYLVIGLAHVVAGSVLESVIDHYRISYKDGGQWIMNQFLGFLAGVLITPWITSRIGRRGGMLLALGSLTAAQAAYSMLLPWGWMLAFAPLSGFGFGMTEAVVGAVIIELVKDSKASAMSRLEVFFGLGALIMPSLAALLIREGIWQMSFPILTALSGITMLLWLTLSFGPADEHIAFMPRQQQDRIARKPEPRRYGRSALPFLVIGALFFTLYVGMEMSLANYLPSILVERSGMDSAQGAGVLSLFWATMVVGRLFMGWIADRTGYVRYLIVTTSAAVVLFAVMGWTHQLTGTVLLICMTGLILSGIFGIALVYVNGLLPGMTERTTSLMVAFGGIGGAVFPRLSGWMMDNYEADTVIWMIAGMSACMLILTIVMTVLGRKQAVAINAPGSSEAG
ncbi:MFS transporter [Paenibacillus cisolokensis]|uniref:MFS transporter n=1 Tax=Paenibacillus cisolokensis TaxID=1658519 RepID=UPI003D2D91AC